MPFQMTTGVMFIIFFFFCKVFQLLVITMLIVHIWYYYCFCNSIIFLISFNFFIFYLPLDLSRCGALKKILYLKNIFIFIFKNICIILIKYLYLIGHHHFAIGRH